MVIASAKLGSSMKVVETVARTPLAACAKINAIAKEFGMAVMSIKFEEV